MDSLFFSAATVVAAICLIFYQAHKISVLEKRFARLMRNLKDVHDGVMAVEVIDTGSEFSLDFSMKEGE